jgi:hypothetical protein
MHNKSLLHRSGLAGCALALALLSGCAIKLGAPVASIDNIQAAKASGMAPAALGEFALAQGKPKALDEGVSLRGSGLSSPFQNSFAQYLKETLATELKAAGLLEPGSPFVIQGWLTDSQADAAISQGSGSLGARFVVVRAGKTVYDKELKASSTWESSFVGATAIPAAVNEYGALYRKLVNRLLSDPDFKAAMSRSAATPM